jgi:hypothetical protein
VGDRYVVYASGAGDERFIGACGRTRLANEAQEDGVGFRVSGPGGRVDISISGDA